MKRFILALFAITAASPALARDQIRIVGSGTVYPFAALAAEQFGEGGKFKTPIVEATGTGGGFKLFCQGVGEDKPDINDASRPILESERQNCLKNGVTGIVEIPIGYDGIVLAEKKGHPSLSLTKRQIFMALARELPDKNGALQKNPYRSWKDIDAALPDRPIRIYGPGPVSGTRDAFAEMVMEKGCGQLPDFAKAHPDEKERSKACRLIREDGAYIESGEDYNIIVQKLSSDGTALGIFGYGFYDANAGKIQAGAIDGVIPAADTIESGSYGVSRRLYVYVKKQHTGLIPGIAAFIRELTGDNAIGPDGYLTEKGLLPLAEEDRKTAREAALKLGR